VLYAEDGLRAHTGRQPHERADPGRQTDGAPGAHTGAGVTGGFRIAPSATPAPLQTGNGPRLA
jgi:hypothetical protein